MRSSAHVAFVLPWVAGGDLRRVGVSRVSGHVFLTPPHASENVFVSMLVVPRMFSSRPLHM